MARKALTKKIRFEVFKRDSFTCQYCGQAAPSVVLNVDHINPVAAGGSNDILNLVTSCFACNSGKSDRELSDQTVVLKQMAQTKLISEKREQLKMLADWQQSLKDVRETELEIFESFMAKNYDVHLSDYGKNEFRKMLRKYGLADSMEAAEKSANQYLHDASVKEQRVKFLDYIPKICYWQKRERENPEEAELRKIAYTSNRLWYSCNHHTLTQRLFELRKVSEIEIPQLMRWVSASSGIMAFDALVAKHFETHKDDYE